MKYIVSIVSRDENGKINLWMSQPTEGSSKDEVVGKLLPNLLEEFTKDGASYMIHGVMEISPDFKPLDQNQDFHQR